MPTNIFEFFVLIVFNCLVVLVFLVQARRILMLLGLHVMLPPRMSLLPLQPREVA